MKTHTAGRDAPAEPREVPAAIALCIAPAALFGQQARLFSYALSET